MPERKIKPRKPEKWPPTPSGWKHGDGSWLWDEDERPYQPFGLQFKVPGSVNRTRVWANKPSECIRKRDEKLRVAAEDVRLREQLANGDASVGVLMDRWYRYSAGAKAPTTRELWARSIKLVKEHALGKKAARSVKPGDVRDLLLWLVDEKDHGASSVRQVRLHVGQAFKFGIEDGYAASNPAYGVKLPGDTRPAAEPKWLMPEEYAAMRSYLSADPTPAHIALLLMMTTGMRGGEVLALSWDAIHLDQEQPYLEVRQAVQRSNGGRVRTVVPTLKTRASAREASLTPDAVRALRTLRADRPFGYLFVNEAGKAPFRSETLSWHCRRACRAIGVEVMSPHKLRHSYASMVAPHEAPADLAAGIGHGDINTLPVYVHKTKRRIDNAAVLGDGTRG